jgi:A/G-specific adenine glycosylase
MKPNYFNEKLRDFYVAYKRDLPWRTPTLQPDRSGAIDLYKVFLSEVMLQQTQVSRVIQKYHEFLEVFPTMLALSQSTLLDVLRVWQGLGYNRRGKYLWQAAKKLQATSCKLHLTPAELDALPGIGPATAASIYCFTYNKPVVFIETNIRKVFLFHFFSERDEVGDDELIPFVRDAMDVENPREWYYALMDYGSYLSKIVPNPNRKSKQYVRQTKFEGSDRQIRGRLLREYLTNHTIQLKTRRERTIWNILKAEGLVI